MSSGPGGSSLRPFSQTNSSKKERVPKGTLSLPASETVELVAVAAKVRGW